MAGVQVRKGGTATSASTDGVNVQVLGYGNSLRQNGYVTLPVAELGGWPIDCKRGNLVVEPGNGQTPAHTRLDFGWGDHNMQGVLDGSGGPNCEGTVSGGPTCSPGLNYSCQGIGDAALETHLGTERLLDIANCGTDQAGAGIGFQRNSFDAVPSAVFPARVQDSHQNGTDDVALVSACGATVNPIVPLPAACEVAIRCGAGTNLHPLSDAQDFYFADCEGNIVPATDAGCTGG